MASALVVLAQEAHETVVELPMHPIWYGVIAFSILMLLGTITLSWKGISHRH